jgi:hypothetical protein
VKLVAAEANADRQSAATTAIDFIAFNARIVSSVTGLDPSEDHCVDKFPDCRNNR